MLVERAVEVKIANRRSKCKKKLFDLAGDCESELTSVAYRPHVRLIGLYYQTRVPGYPGLKAAKPVNPGLKNTSRVCIPYLQYVNEMFIAHQTLLSHLFNRCI